MSTTNRLTIKDEILQLLPEHLEMALFYSPFVLYSCNQLQLVLIQQILIENVLSARCHTEQMTCLQDGWWHLSQENE